MNTESIDARAAVHAALGDPSRLRIVDTLLVGDASPSELAATLGMPSNLLAHHVKALESAGLVARQRSEGDGRRTYLHLVGSALDQMKAPLTLDVGRVVFVCTANTARSHLAAALWRRASPVPAESAGTHPGERIDPRAIAAAERHDVPLPRPRPRHLDEVIDGETDLVVTVCDLAHEELGRRSRIHWSVRDPAAAGTARAYDTAFGQLAARVTALAQHVPVAS